MRLVSLILCVMVFDEPSWVLQSTGSPIISDKKTHSSSSVQNSNKPQQEQSGCRPSEIPESKTFKIPLTSDFTEIRNSRAFFDKTYFLHEWLTHAPRYWFITAPPGSGKSAILDMVRHFCNITSEVVDGKLKVYGRNETTSYELFRGTKIVEVRDFYKKHFQSYSVIYIDFTHLTTITGLASFKNNLCSVIKEMINRYQFLASLQSLNPSDKEFFENYQKPGNKFCLDNFGSALHHGSALSDVLKRVFHLEVIVLADSFDSVWVAHMLRDVQSIDTVLHHFGTFVGCLTRDKQYCSGCTDTATAKFLAAGLFSLSKFSDGRSISEVSVPVSNIVHNHFLNDEYVAKFFALTKSEVDALLTIYSLQDHSRFVADWLGSSLDQNAHIQQIQIHTKLFNTRSTLMYVQHPEQRPTNALLSPASDILQKFQKLFSLPQIGSVMTDCSFGRACSLPEYYRNDEFHLYDFSELNRILKNNNLESVPHYIVACIFKMFKGIGLVFFAWGKFAVKVTNQASADVMRDYLYNNDFIIKRLHVRVENEMSLINAISHLSPSSDSIQKLTRILQLIMARYQNYGQDNLLKALIYALTKKAVDHYGNDIILEANIDAIPEEEKANLTDRFSYLRGNIDILLAWPQKRLGTIINVFDQGISWRETVNSLKENVLAEMTTHKYFDVFRTDLRLSKYNITDKIMIGMFLLKDHPLAIAGEIRDSQNAVKSTFFFD